MRIARFSSRLYQEGRIVCLWFQGRGVPPWTHHLPQTRTSPSPDKHRLEVPLWTEWLTDRCKNITFLQFYLQAVMSTSFLLDYHCYIVNIKNEMENKNTLHKTKSTNPSMKYFLEYYFWHTFHNFFETLQNSNKKNLTEHHYKNKIITLWYCGICQNCLMFLQGVEVMINNNPINSASVVSVEWPWQQRSHHVFMTL